MNGPTEQAVAQVAGWLRDAERVVALTGAGVSAESGVPTFRGDNGLWRNHDPMSLATPDAFRRDPRGVWAWYRWRQALVRRCQPNAGHLALAELERRVPNFVLATQNVDGLHRAAGSTDVIELHGNLFADRCTRCGHVRSAWDDALGFEVDPGAPERDPELPSCERCGGLTRPGVVWFGENLPEGALERAGRAAASSDLLLVVGTSGVVYPAAGLASIAARAGARVVVVNPQQSAHDGVADLTVSASSADALPRLLEAAWG